MKNNKEPRIEYSDIFSIALAYLGFILFLVALHLLTINALGYTRDILNTTFIVFTVFFIAALIFGLVGAIGHILHWLSWSVSVADWKKKEGRGNGG